jgi:hypothetical protein
MTVDLVGTFNVTRIAIPHLKKSPAGSIKFAARVRVSGSSTSLGHFDLSKPNGADR